MAIGTRTSADNLGQSLPGIDLPSADDLAEIRELITEMPGATPSQLAVQARERGLLKDLAGSFAPPQSTRRNLPGRRVPDLRVVFDRFEETAEALGYDLDAPGPVETCPELRLRESHIEICDLSSVESRLPVRFEHCVFEQPARFVGTQFHAAATFLGSTFLSESNFFAAVFEDQAFFGGAHFHQFSDFRGASFHGEVNFFRADFRESLELRFGIFEKDAILNIRELRFMGSTSLGGSLHLHLEQLRQRHGLGYRGRIYGEHSRNVRDLADACEQYGELEANFATQGSPDASAARDWCHYRYMDLHRRSRLAAWRPRWWLDWLFMKMCFGYGIYTKRVLMTGAALILLYAMAYATNGFGLPQDRWDVQFGGPEDPIHMADGPWDERFANAFYFSLVTFSTVGYGDWHPVHWAKLFAGFEGLLGMFIMSVFTVSFARKLLR